MSDTKNTFYHAWTAVTTSWEKRHWPQGLLQTENNLNVLATCLYEAINNKLQPSLEKWQQIVAQAQASGRLQFDTPRVVEQVQPTFEPEKNLPHPNEARLRNIRNLDDINDLSVEQLKVFTQPAAFDSGLRDKFNERVSFIKTHRIRRAKVETAPTQPKTKVQTMLDAIMAQIDSLKGTSDFVQKFKATTKQGALDRLYRDGQSLEAVGRWVSERIRNIETGSIR